MKVWGFHAVGNSRSTSENIFPGEILNEVYELNLSYYSGQLSVFGWKFSNFLFMSYNHMQPLDHTF